MPVLEISIGSGRRRVVELDKRQALSIGRSPSNDVCIEGEDVATLHCRISWNKQAFEAVAAIPGGVDVNGVLKQRAVLADGDTLRIGPADLVLRDAAADSARPDPVRGEGNAGTFGLKPLSEELDVSSLPPAKPVLRPAGDTSRPMTAEIIDADVGGLSAAEIQFLTGADAQGGAVPVGDEESTPKEKRQSRKSRSTSRSHRSETDEERSERRKRRAEMREAAAMQPVSPESPRKIERSEPAAAPETRERPPVEPAPASDASKLSERLRHRLHMQKQRPGERDPLRSPLVLLLGGGAAALLLIGATFYFIVGRQTTQGRFDEALALMNEGKYTQAIRAFEEFLVVYPRDRLANDAQIQLGLARIERHIAGASPNWTEGLKELRDFIETRRDFPDFESLHDPIRRRAEQIAQGAAQSAGESFSRELLAVSDEARNILTTYAPPDAPPTDVLRQIETAKRASEALILKRESLTGALAQIDALLKGGKPLAALGIRRELLARYPEFVPDRSIAQKLEEILEAELRQVKSEPVTVESVTDDHLSPFPPPVSLTFHARSRTDEVSEGRNVFGLSKDGLYAVDSITGEPIWQRVTGWNPPFFPVAVEASTAALIVYDTRHEELQLIDQQTGRLVWRQPEVRDIAGPPMIDEGQVYLVGRGGRLDKVDLETGRVTARLTFSQRLQAPVGALNDGARLVVCGHEEVVYTLTKRPLECVAVSYLGHKPESVVAPLLPMGNLVLMAENQPGQQAVLRVLDPRGPNNRLTQLAEARVPGHVLDTPVIRGRDLFVPSSGETLSTFTVSDEQGQPPLVAGPRFETEGAEVSPVFLSTGPDRQVWMASQLLRRLQLSTDAIAAAPGTVSIGIAAQPIQHIGKHLYVGRTLPYTSALTLFQTDREDLTSQWQAVVGSQPLAWGAFPGQQGMVAVTEGGDVFRINSGQLLGGGFLKETTVRLKLPAGLKPPLQGTQLADGRVAVWCGGAEPRLWLINRLGQVERDAPLPEVLEAEPVLVGSRIALPLPGRIQILQERPGQSRVQDFQLPQGAGNLPRWRRVAAVDEESLVAATREGTLFLIRLQPSPMEYLAASGRLELGAPVEVGPGASADRIAVATSRELHLIDGPSLEPRGTLSLPGTVSNDVWLVGSALFVETDRAQLHLFQTETELKPQWAMPLEGVSLAGAPYVDRASLIVALRDGTVLNANFETGDVLSRASIGRSVVSGPRLQEGELLVSTADGSFVRIGAIREAQ